MKKTKTVKITGGADYAKVSQRLQEFRESNKRGLIETTPTIEGSMVMFKARVVMDKSDEHSAEATGHAYGENKGAKAFEKLETIAVGRALALLGYGSDGEIASSEEMDEFNKFKADKLAVAVGEATVLIKKAKNLDDLKKVWADLPIEVKTELEELKESMKTKLSASKEVKKEEPVTAPLA